jgi:hypothetical protein
MSREQQALTIGPLPAKYDRAYKAPDRSGDAVYEVNLAQLRCTCPDFVSRRSEFPATDARRVCAHIYDKLYATKVEREFTPLLQGFIRYGREMLLFRFLSDDLGTFVVGQPFGPGSVRAIGQVDGRMILATYNLASGEWSSGETDLTPQLAKQVLSRMRSALPDAFGG